MGVFLEVLEWNIPSPAKQQLIIFIVVMVVLLVRVGALRKGVRTGDRSTWGHGAVTTLRPVRRSAAPAGLALGHLAVRAGRRAHAPRALGRQRRPLQPDLHLRRHRAVAHLADRLGRPGVPRPIRAGGRRGPGGRAPRELPAPHRRHALRRRGHGGGGHPGRAARPAHAGPLPRRDHAGLRHLHAERGDGDAVHHRARHQQDALHRIAQPRLHLHQPAQPVRPQPVVAALLRLVLAGRAAGVDLHRADLARPWGGPEVRRRPGQRADRSGHGYSDPSHQAAGLRALRVHGRLRRACASPSPPSP